MNERTAGLDRPVKDDTELHRRHGARWSVVSLLRKRRRAWQRVRARRRLDREQRRVIRAHLFGRQP